VTRQEERALTATELHANFISVEVDKISMGITKEVPPRSEALEMLAEVHPEIYKGLDFAAFQARSYFEEKDASVEPCLQSMLIRFHARSYLQQKFPEVIFDNLSLCGVSLLCKNVRWRRADVSVRLRLWKSPDGGLPKPGDSSGRQIYYTQLELRFPEGASAPELPNDAELKLAVLWNVDAKGILQAPLLVCPKKFDEKTGEIEVWWDIPIPDPTLAANGKSETDRREDLVITKKEKKAEGEG
jgi:hypothetical protein